MTDDTDYNDRMFGVFKKESIATQPPRNTSLTKGYSYIDIPVGKMVFKAHSDDKDSFYVQKATKGQDYAELWKKAA